MKQPVTPPAGNNFSIHSTIFLLVLFFVINHVVVIVVVIIQISNICINRGKTDKRLTELVCLNVCQTVSTYFVRDMNDANQQPLFSLFIYYFFK